MKYIGFITKKDGKQIKLSSNSLNQLRSQRTNMCKEGGILYVSPIIKIGGNLPMQVKAVIKRFDKHG